LIAEASQRFGAPAHWIRAVMRAESAGDKGALSPKGAMGLMQIMPETYAELRLRHHLGVDPYAPRNNILAGAAYLRDREALSKAANSGKVDSELRPIRRIPVNPSQGMAEA
jgi:soluble lytic murein transglycosylase-like protein